MKKSLAVLLALLWQLPSITPFQRVVPSRQRPPWVVPTTRQPPQALVLHSKLWDRLEIEEDPEPMWYLLNCVAGLEIDLLRQCRQICADHPDVVRFIVPTEKKTRSHGAKRMVTETKTKYLGYVFANLRLCPVVYERIQMLDLCRSWMGTVNHKGHKKLPPAPLALNEIEVENFGLEEWKDEVDDEEEDESGIIVDSGDEEDRKPKVDEKGLKEFQGLKVEDMVKVTAAGKFFDEEGTVRRLKEGRILVRFYTYGTLFEEWLMPGDVRNLTELELLRGLSGPTQPITQRDFDEPGSGSNGSDRPGDSQRGQGVGNQRNRSGLGVGNQRERRQDQVANRFTSRPGNRDDNQEQNRNERNWNWYQEQQQQNRQEGLPKTASDKDSNIQAGSDRDNRSGSDWAGSDRGSRSDSNWAQGDVDSQWGRGDRKMQPSQGDRRQQPSQSDRRQQPSQGDRRQPSSQSDRRQQPSQGDRRQQPSQGDRRQGDSDWSAFVSPSASSGDADADDFFASLMSDLSNDLDNSNKKSSQNTQNRKDDSPGGSGDDGDFFDSLMEDLSEASSAPLPPKQRSAKPPPRPTTTNTDEDFFATLEAELGSAMNEKVGSSRGTDDATDDFFAQLEAELSPDGDVAQVKDIQSDSDKPVIGTKIVDFVVTTSPVSETTTDNATKEKKKSTKSSSSDPSSLEKCTVPVLKDMLRERGLKVSGKKEELIDRLK
jgi:transcription antitermination factor NusG